MTPAADLPDLSIVVDDRKQVVYYKTHPSNCLQWRGTDGGYWSDGHVDGALTNGAVVVRDGGTPVGRIP